MITRDGQAGLSCLKGGFALKKKWTDYLLLLLLLLSIIALLFLICRYFQNHREVSAGIVPDQGNWLDFVGSYLGFASSTLLAVAVFLQDRKINALVSSEYDPILILRVVSFERKNENPLDKNFRYTTLPTEDGKSKLLFKQFILQPQKHIVSLPENQTFLRLYLTIQNKGKLPIHTLFITKIVLDEEQCIYKKDIDQVYPELEKIQPDGISYISLKLGAFPQLMDDKVHTLYIHYTAKTSNHVIYKSYCKLLITGDETTLFDGMDYNALSSDEHQLHE